jgi:hypothetical protein
MRNHVVLESQIDSVSNGHYGDCSYCIQSNNFYTDIYPRLVKLSSKDINVFCVAGDVGFKTSKVEYITDDEIIFLATGMSSSLVSNSYLEFTNDLISKNISYSFINL